MLTLVAGLAVAGLFAALFALLQDQLDVLPAGFNIDDTVLRGLADVSDETIVVALFAGVAGMLATETRGQRRGRRRDLRDHDSGGGVLRHRARLGEARQATGAVAVLSLNVLFLVIGAAGTLLLQRLHRVRHEAL